MLLSLVGIFSSVAYGLLNWSVVLQSYGVIMNNFSLIWIIVIAFSIIAALTHRFFSTQSRNSAVTTLLIVSIGVFTFFLFYHNSGLSLYVPSGPIQSALMAGNFLFALSGFVVIFITGFALSSLITRDPFLSLFLSIGIGAGTITVEMMLLALLGLLRPIYVESLTFTLMIISLIVARNSLKDLRRINFQALLSNLKDRWTFTVFVIIVAFFALVLYESISYPPIEWDSLAYGVTYARIIYVAHGIPLISGPSLGIEISANYPPGIQILSVYLYNLAGGPFDIYFRLLEPLFAMSVLLVVYRLGYLIFNSRKYAALTVAAIASIPLFWYYAIEATYVMFTTAEFSVAILCTFCWYTTKQNKFLMVTGLACGFAALTSYVGFIIFLFPLAVLLAEQRSKITVNHFVMFVVPSLFCLVWPIRNLILLGNPIYPLGGHGLNLIPILYQSTSKEIIGNGNGYLRTPGDFLAFVSNIKSNPAGPLLVTAVLGVAVFGVLNRGFFRAKGLNSIVVLTFFYSIIAFVVIGALNGFFLRYLTFFIPGLVLGFVLMYKECDRLNMKLAKRVLLVFLFLGILISYATIEGFSAVPGNVTNSQSAYLFDIYGPDVQSWEWINAHTPANAVIGTYEIRTYYINRTVVPLDGYQMAGLYQGNLSAAQVLQILQNHNISYILSVDWASPASSIVPEAYYESALTKYLGDPAYFPTVYANGASAVYQVGGDGSTDLGTLPSHSSIYLSTEQAFSTVLTNRTTPPTSMIYFPIQPDFQGDLLSISVRSSARVSLELYAGLIPASMTTGWWHNFTDTHRSPPLMQAFGLLDPAISAPAEPGYYTLVIVDWDQYTGPVNVTVDISIIPHYKIDGLTLSSLGVTHFRSPLSNNSAYSVLYYTPNETTRIQVSMPYGGKYSAFEIFNTTVPLNGYQGWTANYELNAVTSEISVDSYPNSLTFTAYPGITYSLVVFNHKLTRDNFSGLFVNLSSSLLINSQRVTISPAGIWRTSLVDGNKYMLALRNETTYSDFRVSNSTGRLDSFNLQVAYLDKGYGNITLYSVVNGSWVKVSSIVLNNTDYLVTWNVHVPTQAITTGSSSAYFVIDTRNNPFYILYIKTS